MQTEKKLGIMQNTYAAATAEAINTYQKLNVLDKIVEGKKDRLAQTAPMINAQIEAEKPEDVFTNMSGVFGCANWTIEQRENGFNATATACKLCALSKQMGGANPCIGWCLNPLSAMIAAIDGNLEFVAESTLMTGPCCSVEVRRK